MIVDIFLGLRQDAHDAVITRLDWDEESQGAYTGPVADRTAKLFRQMQDRAARLIQFAIANVGGNDWNLWLVAFDEEKDLLLKLQDELDALGGA